ncbi:hypothetical protein ABZT17_27325 [Streptomyces sp. NPDC005648]|uniref:hypothetical protein n=1 Tax=Streptomyces sp. NPDC005648 TaxID=3157044 RepID=UPI00339EAA83
MASDGGPDERRERSALAIWFGGLSTACWFFCPFWMLVCFVALPVALVGLVRAWIEFHASRAGRASGPRAVAGGVLSLLGASAAIAYMIFLADHPNLPIQE